MIPHNKQQNQSLKVYSTKQKAVLNAFNTASEFAVEMNIDNCLLKYSEYNTEKLALQSGKIKIRELAEIYTEEKIIAWISTWLITISSHMDFDIQEQQIKTTSIFLLEEIYMLNLAEFTLFFKKLRKGLYGIFYGKFNIQTVVLAAIEYRKERGRILSALTTEEQSKLM